jgi:hypothetical protein
MRGFADVEQLEEYMTRPSAQLEADLSSIGEILVLGVGGKMGPTLARMAKRAAPSSRVIGVARFSEKGLRAKLERQRSSGCRARATSFSWPGTSSAPRVIPRSPGR